jgi:hypothetical protein
VTAALAWLGALIGIAASLSLWWLFAAAGALLLWLHLEQRAAPPFLRLSTATIVSLACYALLLSIALLTVRAALGLLELPVVPFEQAGLAPGMRHASLGYYDKSELRLALAQLLVLTVTFAIVFVRLAGYRMRQQREPLALHPLSAAFAFVLYFASVRLPPYAIDSGYWYPLVAAAARIHGGDWLSFIGDTSQGPLRPHLLALWLWAFGWSTLSLSAAATICNLAAGMVSFALLRRLSGSRAVALLGASYLLLEATTTSADRLAFPAPAHVALAMLLLYLSVRWRGERAWPAFLFGLSLAWDPLFGACAAIAFLSVHGGPILQSRARPLVAMGVGISASLAAALAARGALAGSVLRVDWAPVPAPGADGPDSPLAILPALIAVLLFLALASRKRGALRQWTARRIFAGASLLCGVLYALLATARAEPHHADLIQWVLVPAAALALYGAVRVISFTGRFGAPRRFRAAFSLGTGAMLVVLCFDLFFPVDRLNLAVARYATAYESGRATWYQQCAAGLACDPGAKPTLAYFVRHASRPLMLDREPTRGL